MKKSRLFTAGSFACFAVALSTPIFAQTAAPAAPAEEEDEAAIIVTGSRISSPNLTSSIPVTSIQGEALVESGGISIGDELNQLPALRSTFSQSNSTRFLGTAGLNLLDLRGLGTQRTLVLVNGRRHVGSDILNNGVSVDTNTIPADLIERVDVVTGGNSAVYGSDAIAGVVNFILKKNFDGLQLRGQAGISDYKDAGNYFISATGGKNFADGRGNVAINLEYSRQDQYFASDRPFLNRQNGFITVDSDLNDEVNGTDGIPDTIFFRDIRSAGLSNSGVVRIGGNVRVNGGRDPLGAFYNRPFQFDANGNLAPLTGLRVGLGPNGSFIGGNGENFRSGDQIQLSPQLDRYSANLIGHYDFSDAFQVFVEGKYVRADANGTGNSGPAFITGFVLGDDSGGLGINRERPRFDNPFLTDQARALLIQQFTLSSATGTAPTGATQFSVRENLTGLGARKELFERETIRGVIGFRGTFNDDWNYEVSANYGQFKEKNTILGNLNTQRFLLAIDAVRNPAAGGNIVCNSTINPAAAIDTGTLGGAAGAAILAADVAACIPINVFGGQFTQAQRNYLLADTTAQGKITQFDVNGFVSGDLSQLFELPGGPIGFAIGAEYRRETNFYTQDALAQNNYTFYNAIPTFTSPAFEVKEAFGEIRIPLLKDITLIDELTFTAAGRVADYKVGAGTVYAYNGGVEYAPFADLRFRANYGRSVRAPNLIELFAVPGQNFATVTDPCSARNLGSGTGTRSANCTAAGRPTGYDFVYSASLEIVSGGNPGLKAETSDSLTIGGVYQPSFIPGLSISADYYNIKVNKAISAVGAQTIINQCYDLATINNAFCGLFQRNGAGTGPNNEEAFQILEGSLLQSSVNFSALKVRGIDVEVSYNHDIGGLGKLSSRLNYTHTFQNDTFEDPTDPTFVTRLLFGLGDPVDEFSWNTNLEVGKVSFGYDLRFIGKQLNVAYTSLFPLNGETAQNLDASETNFTPSVFYHDIKLGLDINEKFNMYAGVNNLTNREPPLGLTGIGGGSGIYDNRGRFYYLGVKANF